MKKNIVYTTALLMGLFVFLNISCSKDDDGISSTKTILKGRVFDKQRNLNIEDYKIVLVRFYYVSGGFMQPGGYTKETIDSVYSDLNGSYEMEFDFVDGEEYGLFDENPYISEYIEWAPIQAGEVNVRDINAWYPSILKLEVEVVNNINPPLNISNEVITDDDSYLNFGHESIYEENTTETIYLKTKPNSDIELQFYYNTGYTTEDYHLITDPVQTGLNDTLSLQYKVDCSGF
ncbi:hypothetical protein [Maribacter halichondriae]|uniref:hypothetical protein n=1 Tax=Maribacter halichondriae TaxID=2980554 RepID=UPI0023580C8E|nr:hypothetical protein [Maribacter sp. Hal144]